MSAREPLCDHARIGIIKAGDPNGAYAATNVCGRRPCQLDAMAWAERTTGERAEFVPDREPEPTLFPEWEASQ